MERRGLPVLDALGVYWVRRDRFVYLSLPYQQPFELDPRQVAQELRKRRIVALHHTTTTLPGAVSGLYTCRTQDYSLARIEVKRRRQVRRGLECAQLRRLDPDELGAQGLALNLETMQRQRRFDPEFGVPSRWARFVAAVRDCPEVSVLGAFLDGRLSSYTVACRDGTWLHMQFKMTRTQDLPRNTSSALDAWLLCEAAKDPGLEAVTNSFVPPGDPLRRYKTSMGFEELPLRRALQLHPALSVLRRRWSARATAALSTVLPHVRGLAVLSHITQAAQASSAAG
jgi:hypothetical protein